jgi:L-seryl-tRNA(Ser) seleniumtransferase
MSVFSSIPSIEQLLQRGALARAAARHGREAIADAARQAADELRRRLAADDAAEIDDAAAWIETRAIEIVRARTRPSLRRVINATGVILHTNLGRAPLARAAAERAAELAASYANLEYDLDTGTRGHRHVHAERLLCELTGAEAAAVVNNAAAAALLALSALAKGREVIVSRGELVEIGGGFRVPEILAQSGAVLREVGTTNRTRPADYAAAISDRTALILRVHPSNFQIQGFTERPALADLAAMARKFSVPLVEDLGSGWLGVTETPAALGAEPSVRDSVAAGADLVVFSGDKLLGGPQAGLIVGRRDLVQAVRAHPLMRALRVDKLTYGALEATLALWLEAPSRGDLPIWRALTATAAEIDARALAIRDGLDPQFGLSAEVRDGSSTVGGGSAPGSELTTRVLTLRSRTAGADVVARRLRGGDPPIIARIENDVVVLDLRTVPAEDDGAILAALRALTRHEADPADH